MIHVLNYADLKPYVPPIKGARIHGLLVETNQGPVLVDTGFGLRDYASPSGLVDWFMASMRVRRDPADTAVRQVAALGYDPEDVRHIVMTHLHIDHAGGLPDFPWVQVHVHTLEYEAAMRRKGFIGKFYRPEHWAHGPKWVCHKAGGEQWFGFEAFPVLEGLAPEIWMVPLFGHSAGHCGVAVKKEDGWLLHAGDSTYPIRQGDRFNPLVAWLAGWIVGRNIARIHELIQTHGDQVEMITGHYE